MRQWLSWARRLALAAALAALCATPAWALDAAQARAIAVGDGDARIAALDAAVARADPGLAPFVLLFPAALKYTFVPSIEKVGAGVAS